MFVFAGQEKREGGRKRKAYLRKEQGKTRWGGAETRQCRSQDYQVPELSPMLRKPPA